MYGTLLLVGAALLWSTGGFLIKLVDASPMAVSSARSIIAAAVLMLLTRRVPHISAPGIVRCGFLYALTVTTFVVATKLTTAANAIVIQYTAPIFVALLSWRALGEPVSRQDWTAVALATTGMVIFFTDGLSVGNNLGNAMALTSGICFAALVISLRRIHKRNPADAVIVGNCLAFLIGLPWLLSSAWTTHSLVGISLLGVFQLGLSYFLYTKAIQHVTALEAVLIPVIEPLLNPLWVYIMMGETPSPWAIVGSSIVLGAVTWRALAVRPRSEITVASVPSLARSRLSPGG